MALEGSGIVYVTKNFSHHSVLGIGDIVVSLKLPLSSSIIAPD